MKSDDFRQAAGCGGPCLRSPFGFQFLSGGVRPAAAVNVQLVSSRLSLRVPIGRRRVRLRPSGGIPILILMIPLGSCPPQVPPVRFIVVLWKHSGHRFTKSGVVSVQLFSELAPFGGGHGVVSFDDQGEAYVNGTEIEAHDGGSGHF